jgi:Aspartyl protease
MAILMTSAALGSTEAGGRCWPSTSVAAAPVQNMAAVEVPMLFRGPMPAVEVMVNGQGPFLFAIDTGASGMARADASLVARLALPEVGEARGSDGSGRGGTSMKLVRLNSLTIAGLEFRHVTAASRDYNNSARMPHIDEILGFNLFADHLLTLDYGARRVRIEKGRLPDADGKEILTFESARGVPTIELQVGDIKIKAHIDTGNAVGEFLLPADLAEKLIFSSQPVTVGKARTVSSEVEIKEAPLKGMIRLGRFEFSDPVITYPALSQFANIGSRAFRDFALTFDQKNLRVKLIKRDPMQPAERTGDPAQLSSMPGAMDNA